MATGRQRLAQAQATQAALPINIMNGLKSPEEFVRTREERARRDFERDVTPSLGADPRQFFEQGTPLRNLWQLLASSVGAKTGRMNAHDERVSADVAADTERAAQLREQNRESIASGLEEARRYASTPDEVAQLDELGARWLRADRYMDHPDADIAGHALDARFAAEAEISDVLEGLTQRKYKLIDDAGKSLEADLRTYTAQADEIDGIINAYTVGKGEYRHQIDLIQNSPDLSDKARDTALRTAAQGQVGRALSNDSMLVQGLQTFGSAAQLGGAGVAAVAPGLVGKAVGGVIAAVGTGADIAAGVVSYMEKLPTALQLQIADELNDYSIEFNQRRGEQLREEVIPAVEQRRMELNEYMTPIAGAGRTTRLEGTPLPAAPDYSRIKPHMTGDEFTKWLGDSYESSIAGTSAGMEWIGDTMTKAMRARHGWREPEFIPGVPIDVSPEARAARRNAQRPTDD